MEIKTFKCGLCTPEKRIGMTRKELRKHLEEHGIRDQKFNFRGSNAKNKGSSGTGRLQKRNWVMEEKN